MSFTYISDKIAKPPTCTFGYGSVECRTSENLFYNGCTHGQIGTIYIHVHNYRYAAHLVEPIIPCAYTESKQHPRPTQEEITAAQNKYNEVRAAHIQ